MDFLSTVDAIILQIRISRVQHDRKYSVALTAVDKDRIRHYVNQIKAIIDNGTIPISKKDSLNNKLNYFLREVDKIRTSLESFIDLEIGLATIGGQSAKELEPARKWLDSISRLIGNYRDIEDADRALLPPKERPRIEPPKLRLPPPDQPPTFDDQLPFRSL